MSSCVDRVVIHGHIQTIVIDKLLIIANVSDHTYNPVVNLEKLFLEQEIKTLKITNPFIKNHKIYITQLFE